jgi:hypothetical protein
MGTGEVGVGVGGGMSGCCDVVGAAGVCIAQTRGEGHACCVSSTLCLPAGLLGRLHVWLRRCKACRGRGLAAGLLVYEPQRVSEHLLQEHGDYQQACVWACAVL